MSKNKSLENNSIHRLQTDLSRHFESEHHFSPLAAKIYSLLILSETKHLTFEQLLEFTEASKSSVSNQLNYLIDEGRIDFDYIKDQRKRYFKTKEDYLNKTLESHLEKIEKEISILSKVIRFKEDRDFDKTLVDIFKNHLANEKRNLLKTIEQLNKKRHNINTHEK
ncbi:GbsR/MarR family transcriptional regulator [Psychroflexus tropicus]|uniref:GbsR/MarR family transcriptional regulator n=1 Tax=Psychroflexus tropicus TaxID=197345 RepID=UPI00036409F8|nr:hypothetical protein [Psychroflexus tropicus]